MTAHLCCVLTAVLLSLFGYFSTTDANGGNAAKSGECPSRGFEIGVCFRYCAYDHECPNKEKCCSNGCGYQCMAPHTVKPGRCPKWKRPRVCADSCSHDGQCPGKSKCCPTTCGHACIKPCRVVRRKKLG